MNIWLMIWVFIVVFICGVFLWSMQILFKQKRAWAEFATKNNMKFTRGAMMKSPLVNGLFRGFPLTVYSEEQPTPDQRGRRFRTVVQFELPGGMPIEGIFASPESHGFANGLVDLVENYKPPYESFPDTILCKTRSAALLMPYMTEERARAIQTLLTIKSINAIFIFDLTSTFLRLESPDAFADAAKLERLCVKVADQATILSLR